MATGNRSPEQLLNEDLRSLRYLALGLKSKETKELNNKEDEDPEHVAEKLVEQAKKIEDLVAEQGRIMARFNTFVENTQKEIKNMEDRGKKRLNSIVQLYCGLDDVVHHLEHRKPTDKKEN